jgi:hypothetical protein
LKIIAPVQIRSSVPEKYEIGIGEPMMGDPGPGRVDGAGFWKDWVGRGCE